MNIDKLKFVNLMIDEDGYVSEEEGKLCEFEWGDYVEGFCESDESVKERLNEIIDGDSWWSEEEEEKEKLVNGIDKLIKLCKEKNGVIVEWCVEYDNSWMMIYGDDKELIIEWLNRRN